MKLKYLHFHILLTLIFWISNQTLQSQNFESNSVWVKIKPQYRKSFDISHTKLADNLRQIGAYNISPIFNAYSILNHQRNMQLRVSKKQKNSGINLGDYYSIQLLNEANELTINKLRSSGYFEIVEKVGKATPLSYQPNDDNMDSLTSLNGQEFKIVNAFKAWGIEKGDTNVVIGISDLGVDYNHIDLINNVKLNYKDTIDGLDNDLDGFTDNFVGWDFAQNDQDPMSDPQGQPHGTWVSSVSSATPDNDTMLCGSGFNCKFVPLKIASQGAIFIDAAYNSIIYAAMNGYKVINLSWTEGNYYSQIHQDIINSAVLDYDIAIVAAAGNWPQNTEYFPASYDNVLSVAGTVGNSYWDNSTFSNFVDIAAPAHLEIVTDGNGIRHDWGTSLSSPLVSGALALVRSKYTNLTALQAMERLRMAGISTDTMSTFSNFKHLFGRRLDMYNALVDTTLKSVRMTSNTPVPTKGNVLTGGDTITIEATFTNFLSKTSPSCKVVLSCDSSYISVLDSVFIIGSLGTLEEKLNTKNLRFLISKDAPKLAKVKFRLEYYDTVGHYDYQYFYIQNININYLDLDTNNITLTIADNSKMGYADFDATMGSGFKYLNGNNSLYEAGLMLSSEDGKLSDVVRALETDKRDFISTDYIKYASEGIAPQHIVTKYIDTNQTRVGVSVTQNSFAWKQNGTENFVIVEYQIKNTSGKTIKKLNAGVFADWDIQALNTKDPNAYAKNKVVWDSINKLGICYNSLTNGLYIGSKLIDASAPIFAGLDNSQINGKFTDSLKVKLLNSGVSTKQVGQGSSLGKDISEIIGNRFVNVENDKTVTFAIVFCVGLDILEVQKQAIEAEKLYLKARTSATPADIDASICKNTDFYQKLSGEKFNFYKSTPISPANYINEGDVISINNLQKDTLFYYTNQDNLMESPPSKISIKINSFSANSENIINVSNGKYVFNTNQTHDKIVWYINGDSTSNINNYVHQFESNGVYKIKLVLTNVNGCIDSSSKTIEVTELVLSLVNDIFSNEIEIYPVPTKDFLYVEIPDHFQGNPIATITNLIGVETGEKYNLKNGKNQIDVSKFETGIYFINVIVNGKVHKFKFIVT